MPPQQLERLLDLFDKALGFRAHVHSAAANAAFRFNVKGI
jgi:hypothetical protein